MKWILLITGILAAQRPASFEGAVINSSTHEPIRKATVMLRSRDFKNGTNYAAETDADGKFAFRAVEPGSYTLTAERQGYSPEVTGAPGAAPKPLPIAAGDAIKDAVIRLVPPGAIAGRVIDEEGDPVRGADVQAGTYIYSAGKRQLRVNANVNTGPQGEYRLFGLAPGAYYIKVTLSRSRMRPNAMPVDYTPTYFPGVIDVSQAAPLKLAAGSEFRNIDITLRKTRTYSISGSFPDDDYTKVNYNVQLLPGSDTMTGRRMAQDFSFQGLPDGSYVVSAVRTEGQKSSYATQSVQVSGADVTGVNLTFQAGKEVHGTVRFEGKPLAAKPATMYVTLKPEPPVGNFRNNRQINPDGTFQFDSVPPVMMEVSMSRVPGAYLKSVQLGDKALPDRRFDLSRTNGPLTITMGTDMAEVEGTAKLSSGQPAARVRITVIPYETNLGRTELQRFGFTNDDGEFQIKDVAPGDYKVFAWEDVDIGAPQDPEFRKPFETSGVPVKLESNGHAALSLTAIKTRVE